MIAAGDAILYPFLAPEGEYEFYAWTQPESGYFWHSQTPFSVRFHVTPGKAIYIGNLALLMKGLSTFGLEARDRRDTELPIFLANYPNIREDDVEVAISSLGATVGGTGSEPEQGPSAEFLRVPGARAPGRTRFVPSLEGYVQTGLVAELKAMGIATGTGRAALRGEIQDAALDLSGWGFGATVTIRYQVTDAAGSPIYTALETTATTAGERAASEARAFDVAIRKNAEALASDPEFTKAIR